MASATNYQIKVIKHEDETTGKRFACHQPFVRGVISLSLMFSCLGEKYRIQTIESCGQLETPSRSWEVTLMKQNVSFHI